MVVAHARPLHAQFGGVASPFKQRQQQPASISGSQFVYDRRADTFIVRGNARIDEDGTELSADELDYQRTARQASAVGDVHLVDPEIELSAAKARINLDDETGELDDAKVNLKRRNFVLSGQKIAKLLGQHYVASEGSFSSCGCEQGTPSWSISARELDVHLGQSGSVRDARFKILGHSVLRIPYAIFPAGAERHSGFLSPRLGQSRERGFQYTQPYFIDISKSSDATLAFDAETQARLGMLAEYRIRNGEDDYLEVVAAYLNEYIRKNKQADVVDKQIADPHIPMDRYGLIGLLRQHLTPDLVAYGDGNTVSDSLYLREMNIYTLSHGYGSNFNVLRQSVSDFGLQQSLTNAFVRAQGTWTQDLIQPQSFALQYLPELLLSGRQPLLGGLLYSDYDLQAVEFYRSRGIDGQRVDLNPRLVLPFRWKDYFYGYADGGARETVYDVSGHTIGVIPVGSAIVTGTNNNGLFLDGLAPGGFHRRDLAYAGGGISTVLEKIYDFHHFSIQRLKHVIEPLVDYTYIPSVNQDRLPLFDEVDRVNPRSLLSYGIVSRLYARSDSSAQPRPQESSEGSPDEDSQPEGAQAPSYRASGQAYELARLTLLESYDASHPVTANGSGFSDLDAGLTLFPTSVVALSSTLGYDPGAEQLTQTSVLFSVRPPWGTNNRQALPGGRALQGGPFLQVSYTFVGTSQAVHQIGGRAYYEFFDRVGLYYEPSYDIADGRLLSTIYGIRLKSRCDCWIIDLAVTDRINPREVQTLFQVTLGGLGSAGRNPFGQNPFAQAPAAY